MNRKHLFIFIFTIAVQTSFSQTKSIEEISIALKNLSKAMIDADSNMLCKITADSLSYGHSGGTVEGKKAFVEKIVSGKSDFVNMDFTDQTIYISGNTAIVRHNLNAVTNDKGVPGEVHLKVLLVWQKQKGVWKLLARQAVKLS